MQHDQTRLTLETCTSPVALLSNCLIAIGEVSVTGSHRCRFITNRLQWDDHVVVMSVSPSQREKTEGGIDQAAQILSVE